MINDQDFKLLFANIENMLTICQSNISVNGIIQLFVSSYFKRIISGNR